MVRHTHPAFPNCSSKIHFHFRSGPLPHGWLFWSSGCCLNQFSLRIPKAIVSQAIAWGQISHPIKVASRSFPLLVSSSDHIFSLSSSNPLFSQQVKFFQPSEAVISSFVSPPFLWPTRWGKYYFFNPGLTATLHGQLPPKLQALAYVRSKAFW